MEKEFVTYEQAVDLKELGFDEPCFGYYNIDPQLKTPAFNMVKPFEHEWCLPAPLKQQAFRWFREKYGLEGVTQKADSIFNWYKYCIWRYTDDGKVRIENAFDMEIKSYEEAEQACLDKLIEIVKTK